VRPLSATDLRYFDAAQGWLALGDWLSANDELENITPLFRAHPEVLALLKSRRVEKQDRTARHAGNHAGKLRNLVCPLSHVSICLSPKRSIPPV
jgi:hypothetical protein